MIYTLRKAIFYLYAIFVVIFCIVPQIAAADDTYTFKWIPDTSDFNPNGGEVSYFDATFSVTDTNQYYMRWVINFFEYSGRLPEGFTFVLYNGPNPKGEPGELAIFYFDGTNQADPKLTVYGYNGQSGNLGRRSYIDGDGLGGAPDKILSSVADSSWINELVIRDEVDGSRSLIFDIDATAIVTHNPLYNPPGVTWFGTGFDEMASMWFHPMADITAAYDVNGWLTNFEWCHKGWYDTSYQCAPDDRTGAVCDKENDPRCENPSLVDFNDAHTGEVITDQYNQYMTVSAGNNADGHPHKAIIFDSSNPTGDDEDLGTPNQNYGGPGTHKGSQRQGDGFGNDTALEKVLIIAENDFDGDFDGYVDEPDDEAQGGCITFAFDEPTIVETFNIVDIEPGITASFKGFDADDNEVHYQEIPGLGDNSVIKVYSDYDEEVNKLEICYPTSGAVDDLLLCQCNPDDCGICGGDNSTCSDCADVPFGESVEDESGQCCLPEELDECGVCFGDGSTCQELQCAETNISSLQQELDSKTVEQERVLKRALKQLRRKDKSRKTKRFVRKSLSKANELYNENWVLAFSLPEVIVECLNTEFCVQVDNTAILSQYDSNSQEFDKLTRRAVKKLRKADSSRPKAGKKLLRQSSKLLAEALALSSTVPTINSVCN